MKNCFLITLILLVANALGSYGQTGQEIMKKSGDLISLDAMEMVSTLKIYNEKGSERMRKMATASKKFGQTTKMIMKFTDPADVRGTAILIYDNADSNDDMWIYLPALRKSRRIVSNEKGRNFMGSEFTNADMSKPNLSDFNYIILGEENINSKICWKVETTPKTSSLQNEYGYSKRVSLVEKDTYRALEIEYFDLQGKPHRKEILKDYRKLQDGRYFAFYMEMNNLQNKRKSVMIVEDIQTGSTLSENVFTPAMLEK